MWQRIRTGIEVERKLCIQFGVEVGRRQPVVFGVSTIADMEFVIAWRELRLMPSLFCAEQIAHAKSSLSGFNLSHVGPDGFEKFNLTTTFDREIFVFTVV
jgi:hypothetical protein